MNYLLHFLMGFAVAFASLIPPGMINMTTVRTTLEHGKNKAIEYAAGASVVVLLQASIALYFSGFLNAHPEIIERLKMLGGLVLLLLSFMFFRLARKKFKAEGKKKSDGFFILGLGMSSINMLAIPFYLFWGTYLSREGHLTLDVVHISFFVTGASLGAFALFYVYSIFAKYIEVKAQFIARNINYILSALFLVLGLIAWYGILAS